MLKKLLSLLDKSEEYIIICLFALVLLLVGYVVFARYFFAYTPSWAEQVARIMFVWITFAGVSLAAKRSMHLRVVAVNQFLPEKAGRWMLFFGETVSALVALVIAYRILLFSLNIYERGQTFAAMPTVPVWIMYIAGAFGMFGMGIRLIQTSIWPVLTGRDRDPDGLSGSSADSPSEAKGG